MSLTEDKERCAKILRERGGLSLNWHRIRRILNKNSKSAVKDALDDLVTDGRIKQTDSQGLFFAGTTTTTTPPVVAGLLLEPDSTPLSGAMSVDNDLIDGNKSTAITSYWYPNYSYGIDFGESKEVAGFDVYCTHAGGIRSSWGGSSYDSFSVYESSDNSTWTLVSSGFDGPPIFYTADGITAFRIKLPVPKTNRYFKIRFEDGGATIAFDQTASGSITEIEEYFPTTTSTTTTTTTV